MKKSDMRNLHFIVGPVSDFELYGIDTTYLLKSIDGTKAIMHTEMIDFQTIVELVGRSCTARTKEFVAELKTNSEWDITNVTVSLDMQKELLIQDLTAKCSNTITRGFLSNALGEVKEFDCQTEDQDNIRDLYNAALMIQQGYELPEGAELTYKGKGELECYPVTPEQCVTLYMHMMFHIKVRIDEKNHNRIRVYNCNNQEEFDVVKAELMTNE